MASQQYCSHHKSSHVLDFVISECPQGYHNVHTGICNTRSYVSEILVQQTDTEGHKNSMAMLNFPLI